MSEIRDVLCVIGIAVISFLTGNAIGFSWDDMHGNRRSKNQHVDGKRVDKPARKRWTTSKVIALGVLVMDAVSTLAVLALCGLAIVRRFEGALPYLTTLIGALQAVTGVVLGAYFNKSKAENTKGGIVYDAALGVPYSDTDLKGGTYGTD